MTTKGTPPSKGAPKATKGKKASPRSPAPTTETTASNGTSDGRRDAVSGYGTARRAQPFPYWDRRRLIGEWSVEESVERIVNYKYAEQHLSAALGGWVATIPELDVKAMFGPHCYQHAWHADLWRTRLPELRETREDRAEPVNEAFETFMAELTSPGGPDETIEKLVGVYRVLVPHLLATYSFHQRVTSDIVDAPTVRILKFMIDDDVEQLITGEMMIQDLARTTELRERAGKWQTHLDVLLVRSGGVAGEQTLGGHSAVVMPAKAVLGKALRDKRGVAKVAAT
ncbi:MAG: hypothetical protein Q8K58_01060 [Acidimicrobiales bacterium]|nr:hypothetical protein [Acidimicrobiales bacterium]